jgi:hypothetical protein
VKPASRYHFDEVRAALKKHWGLALHRGGDLTDLGRDGRWDVCYSKSGFVIGGNLPGYGHGYQRYTSLARVVHACDLEDVIRLLRKIKGGRS